MRDYEPTIDIYEEPDTTALTQEGLGPLTPLVGRWYGANGVDVHPAREGAETSPYVENASFTLCDVQTNGPQALFGLRYHFQMFEPDGVETFHDQMGHLLWDPQTETVWMTLSLPRGMVALAKGHAKATDRQFTLVAVRGHAENGIVDNTFLTRHFTTERWQVTFTMLDDGSYRYDQSTLLNVSGQGLFDHTDHNTLYRVGDTPLNPRQVAYLKGDERA